MSDTDVSQLFAREAMHAAIKEFEQNFFEEVSAALKDKGFAETYKEISRDRPKARVLSVYGGDIEESGEGTYDAALETEAGRVVLRGGQRTDRHSDPQIFDSRDGLVTLIGSNSPELTNEELIERFQDAAIKEKAKIICLLEFRRFDDAQQTILLPLIWHYILKSRDSNDRRTLVAVASAIRKYIAIMPMERMGELATLLDPTSRSPLPIELEIEVAKMVYRNFETHPPAIADPHPELASRLLELSREYTGPRVLLRENHSTVAALAIGAIVAMRSPLADVACRLAAACPHIWFGELIEDDLEVLQEKWNGKSEECVTWLANLRSSAFASR